MRWNIEALFDPSTPDWYRALVAVIMIVGCVEIAWNTATRR